MYRYGNVHIKSELLLLLLLFFISTSDPYLYNILFIKLLLYNFYLSKYFSKVICLSTEHCRGLANRCSKYIYNHVYYITQRTDTLLFFAATDLYIDQWLHYYSSLPMTISFKTQNQIHQFLPLWGQFEPEVPISWQLFLSHNVCLCDIYQQLWPHAVIFKPKEVITEKRKTVKCAIFQVYIRSEVANFLSNRMFCVFFFIFFICAMDLDTQFEI